MVCDFKFDSIILVLVFEEKNFNPYYFYVHIHTRVYILDDGWVTGDGQAFTILIDGRVARNTSKQI